MEKITFSKSHRDWEDFISKLSQLLNSHCEDLWPYCNCRHDYWYSERLLKEMPGVDVEATIDDFKHRYGPCDHALLIFFNS